MQYILTQEEYDKLSNKSNQELLDKYDELYDELRYLREVHNELKDKYNRLLVFGVTNTNERLKEH